MHHKYLNFVFFTCAPHTHKFCIFSHVNPKPTNWIYFWCLTTKTNWIFLTCHHKHTNWIFFHVQHKQKMIFSYVHHKHFFLTYTINAQMYIFHTCITNKYIYHFFTYTTNAQMYLFHICTINKFSILPTCSTNTNLSFFIRVPQTQIYHFSHMHHRHHNLVFFRCFTKNI